MGKTAFKGPVYGAKSLLWNYGPYTQTGTTGASTVLFAASTAGGCSVRVVPPYEDWFITEALLTASSISTVTGGHGVYIKSEGGSTTGITRHSGGYPSTVSQTIASFTLPLVTGSSSANGSTTVGASPGEYEGLYVPAGSSIRIVSSGITLIGGLNVQLMGFIRFVSSTRAEL